MITVYTVILNDYDNLRPPAVVEPGVEYVCFSDVYHDCPPWRIVPCPALEFAGSRASRVPKILSHLAIESDFSIYHDGSLSLACRARDLIAETLQFSNLALYRHPCRETLQDEVALCRNEGVGYGGVMVTQADRYLSQGLRPGLWAGGVVIRRNVESVQRFNEIWWREFAGGCSRDQIALPRALQESGVSLHTIDADILQDSERFTFRFHAAFVDHHGNGEFLPAREKRAAIRQRLSDLCK